MNKQDQTKWIFMGDPQCDRFTNPECDYSRWGELLKTACIHAYGSIDPAAAAGGLLLLSGDIVNVSIDKNEWKGFFEGGGEILRMLQVYSPTGNHDRNDAYEHYFGTKPSGPPGMERKFYSFDHGCCHFTVVDTNYMGSLRKQQINRLTYWICNDLLQSAQPVKALLMHHPFWSVGSSLADEVRAAVMRKNYLGLLKKCGADIIMCGHQHVYCRTASEDGPVQIMGVSGDKYHHAKQICSMDHVTENISVATVFSTDGDIIRAETVDHDGNLIDAFEFKVKSKKPAAGVKRPDDSGADKIRTGCLEICGEGVSSPVVISSSELDTFSIVTVPYSCLMRSDYRIREVNGILLTDILHYAGWNGDGDGVMVTCSDGYDTAFDLTGMLGASFFDEDGTRKGSAPPLITRSKEGKCGLVFGQKYPGERTTRYWLRDIAALEIIKLEDHI